jgi:ADP-ribose pyrophosphatase YjhB (NUDIX family)
MFEGIYDLRPYPRRSAIAERPVTKEDVPVTVGPARDRRLLGLLKDRTPASVTEVVWARPLRISAYVGAAALPENLVMSVRCLVLVDDHVVLCTNVDRRSHAWPGGRRLPGEAYKETARREVHEETGWFIDPNSVTPIGFLHLHNLGEPLEPYPHPDTLQLVVAASASERAGDDWTDTEGYELSSRLVPLSEAQRFVSQDEPMCVPFLHHLQDTRADPR